MDDSYYLPKNCLYFNKKFIVSYLLLYLVINVILYFTYLKVMRNNIDEINNIYVFIFIFIDQFIYE